MDFSGCTVPPVRRYDSGDATRRLPIQNRSDLHCIQQVLPGAISVHTVRSGHQLQLYFVMILQGNMEFIF